MTFAFSESRYSSFDPAAQDLTKPNTPPDTAFAFNDFVSAFNNHQRCSRTALSERFGVAARFVSGIDYEQERAVFDSGFAGQNRVASSRNNLGAFLQDQVALAPNLFVTAVAMNTTKPNCLLRSLALTSLKSAPFTGTVGFGTKVMPKVAAMYVVQPRDLQSVIGATRYSQLRPRHQSADAG
ncbi:MAG: hypothetical protein U0X75_24665 [Acidobacteriota bacterium]